jgi:hypothetical protein
MKKISLVLGALALMFVALPVIHAEDGGSFGGDDENDHPSMTNQGGGRYDFNGQVPLDQNGQPIPGKRGQADGVRNGGMGFGIGLKEIRNEWKDGKEQTRSNMKEKRKEFEDRKDEIKNEMDGKREELRNKMHDLKDEFKSKIGEMRGVIMLRFTASIARIENIQTRMQSRIDTLKTAGNAVTTIQASLDSSKSHLVKAKDYVVQAKVLIENAHTNTSSTATTTTDTPTTPPVIDQSVKDQIHSLLKSAKDELKLAFQDMRDTMKAIKLIEHPESDDDNTATTNE